MDIDKRCRTTHLVNFGCCPSLANNSFESIMLKDAFLSGAQSKSMRNPIMRWHCMLQFIAAFHNDKMDFQPPFHSSAGTTSMRQTPIGS
ncbi:hypothetical protein JHK87_018945 [Glycine soja]|nr:hypothetical protein JHK87_018945 [Glycine soja]